MLFFGEEGGGMFSVVIANVCGFVLFCAGVLHVCGCFCLFVFLDLLKVLLCFVSLAVFFVCVINVLIQFCCSVLVCLCLCCFEVCVRLSVRVMLCV